MSGDGVDDDSFDVVFKIVIIGDSSVGKSNLLSRFTANEFSAASKATIGVEFATKTISIDGETVKAQLWDTAGQEKYRAITSVYYRNSAGAMLVYDITNQDSFNNIVDQEKGWLRELRKNTDEELSGMIIGNKSDLSDRRQVAFEEVLEFASSHNLQAMETSALHNTNVDDAFEQLIKEAYQKLKAKKSERQDSIAATATATKATTTNGESPSSVSSGTRVNHQADIVSLYPNSKKGQKGKRKSKCC